MTECRPRPFESAALLAGGLTRRALATVTVARFDLVDDCVSARRRQLSPSRSGRSSWWPDNDGGLLEPPLVRAAAPPDHDREGAGYDAGQAESARQSSYYAASEGVRIVAHGVVAWRCGAVASVVSRK